MQDNGSRLSDLGRAVFPPAAPAPEPPPQEESVPETEHCHMWDRGVRPKHTDLEYRPLGGNPVAIEYVYRHHMEWHREGGGVHGPCSFTVYYTGGFQVRVSGVGLQKLYQRVRRRLVMDVWAVERNPLAEKVLPEGTELVYDITISGPEEEEE